ncbi:DNA polymerase I [Thermostilla marina]
MVGECDPQDDEALRALIAGKHVYVVDSHSLIHQLFHALPEMTAPDGRSVGAVFGFCRDLFNLVARRRVDFLFCAFDLPDKTFRHELDEAYKENREEAAPDLIQQFPLTAQLAEVLGIPVLSCPGYEADDILATVATVTEGHGGECFLVTNDKDCRQLLSDHVRLYNLRKHEVFDAESLRKTWGIRPDQVVDFQALVGDAGDNVPGVPLIGPKIAAQLLNRYGSLEEIFAHADEIKGKRGENLRQFQEQARHARSLVQLERSVPIAIPWCRGIVGATDIERARSFLQSLGFRRLIPELDRWPHKKGGIQPAATASASSKAKVTCIETPEQLQEVASQWQTMDYLSIDTETTGLRPREADLVGISVCDAQNRCYYIPIRSPAGQPAITEEQAIAVLRPILEGERPAKIGQNLKYDWVVFRRVGVPLRGIAFDTMVASYLLDAGERNHNLDELAARYLGYKTTKISELIGKKKKDQKRMDEVPLAQIAEYAGEDAWVPMQLKPLLESRLRSEGLYELFSELEIPLIDVLAEMEFWGIRVDPERLAELSSKYRQKMEELHEDILELAGEEFNIASPKQLGRILFDTLALPVVKRTKTGPSTDAEVLEILADLHPLPAKVLAYRQYAKLLGTYIEALPQMILAETGRIHASFHQAVTATGRLSSSDPNLQNIPIRTEEGREIRSAFTAEPGYVLIAADYSQIELRMLAHLSQDEQLTSAFERGEDIHAKVASQVFGVPLSEVTADMRRQAKAVNFGVIYGQSPFGLAKQLKISQDEAAAFIDAYFRSYPGIARFLEETLDTCRKQGFVTTILNRTRAIEGVRPQRKGNLTLPERTAINTVIQGSAADLIKLAMLAVHRKLAGELPDARLILQIHDELIVECPRSVVQDAAVLLKREMENAMRLRVPIVVDVKCGENWADMSPLEV